MVKFFNLGFNSLEDYNLEFEETLLETNHTYDFFVNWEKVYNNLEENIVEISILNSLNKIPSYKVESEFRRILSRYPGVVSILPSILAVREKKVDFLDIDHKEFSQINFESEDFDIDEIVNFCINTGLLDLFSNITDLYSYLVGTEVGLDTNARKNRSGHVFEDIVGELLTEKIKDYPQFKLNKEDTIPFQRTKRWDYVIYKYDKPKFFFECNFYNGTGSKPIEVANAYVDLQNQLEDSDLIFIWVTDGKGWKRMFKTLKEVSPGIDYIVNYTMLENCIDDILMIE